MGESKFIQLTDYCLVEYVFADAAYNPYKIINEDFVVLRNDELGTYQIYNVDAAIDTTKNIQDVSLVYAGNNRYVYNDTEVVPNYDSYDDNIVKTQVSANSIPYDVVRFHFISGYTFDEFDGLQLSVAHKMNNGLDIQFASLLSDFATMSYLVVFNPRPMFVRDAFYDRYVEIRVPSIRHINEDYYTSINPGSEFGGLITPTATGGYVGLEKNAPIKVALRTMSRIDPIVNSNDSRVQYSTYRFDETYDGIIPQTGAYSGVGAVIQDAADGDYIEYYATYNGGFPADFMATLEDQNPNDEWIIIHQLSVFEQVGSSYLNTKTVVDIQTKDYDTVNTFRPVLKYAATAVSFSIDYMLRITNKRNGEQIIRTGSFTSMEPKKYGKNFNAIKLDGAPSSHKIYNKIFKSNMEATNLFVEPTPDKYIPEPEVIEVQVEKIVEKVIEKKIFVPVFTNYNKIQLLNKSINAKETDEESKLIFRQGLLRVLITPFDNMFKFQVFTTKDNVSIPYDLTFAASFNLVFVNNNDKKVTFPNLQDSQYENLKNGEIVFNVPKDDSVKILKFTNKMFYLTSISPDKKETMMYTGFWNKVEERDTLEDARNKAKIESQNVPEPVPIPKKDPEVTKKVLEERKLDIPGYVPKKPTATREVSNVQKVNKVVPKTNKSAKTTTVPKVSTSTLKRQDTSRLKTLSK